MKVSDWCSRQERDGVPCIRRLRDRGGRIRLLSGCHMVSRVKWSLKLWRGRDGEREREREEIARNPDELSARETNKVCERIRPPLILGNCLFLSFTKPVHWIFESMKCKWSLKYELLLETLVLRVVFISNIFYWNQNLAWRLPGQYFSASRNFKQPKKFVLFKIP